MLSRSLRKIPTLSIAALSATAVFTLASAHSVSANQSEPWRLAQATDAATEVDDTARKLRKEKNRAERLERRNGNHGDNGNANADDAGTNNAKAANDDAKAGKRRPTAPATTTPPPPVEKTAKPILKTAPPKPVVDVNAPPVERTAKPILKTAPPKPVVDVDTPPVRPTHRNSAGTVRKAPAAGTKPTHVPPAYGLRNKPPFNPAGKIVPSRNAPATSTPSATSPVEIPLPPKPVVKTLKDAKAGRIERREAGNRVVIKEADKRTIVRQGNRVVIQKDESAQVRRLAPTAVVTHDRLGRKRSVVERSNNVQIITETDRNGQLLRRYRRDGSGQETAIIDNRRRKSNFGRNLAIGVGVGAGLIAGAAILNSIVDVPPPRVRVPRDKYIIDYGRASDDDVYEALSAPPVDEYDDHYTLDQVRATPRLRDRMRRVDLDDINFETGSWDVRPSQYRKLERIARAMNRVIERNPNEVFLIEGYTDAVGSDVDNLTLSDRRAESVSFILSEQFDVPFENLTTQGYGEDYLKIDTLGPEIENRRVAVRRITPLLKQDNVSSTQPRPGRDEPEDNYEPGYDDRRGDAHDAPSYRWRRYNRE